MLYKKITKKVVINYKKVNQLDLTKFDILNININFKFSLLLLK